MPLLKKCKQTYLSMVKQILYKKTEKIMKKTEFRSATIFVCIIHKTKTLQIRIYVCSVLDFYCQHSKYCKGRTLWLFTIKACDIIMSKIWHRSFANNWNKTESNLSDIKMNYLQVSNNNKKQYFIGQIKLW